MAQLNLFQPTAVHRANHRPRTRCRRALPDTNRAERSWAMGLNG